MHDLRMAVLRLGEKLPAYTRAFADVRDTAVKAGDGDLANFYAEICALMAEQHQVYTSSLTNHMNDWLDDRIKVVPEQ